MYMYIIHVTYEQKIRVTHSKVLLNLLACVYSYAKLDISQIFADLTFISKNYLSVAHLCHSRARAHQMRYLFNVFVPPSFWLGIFLSCLSGKAFQIWVICHIISGQLQQSYWHDEGVKKCF